MVDAHQLRNQGTVSRYVESIIAVLQSVYLALRMLYAYISICIP